MNSSICFLITLLYERMGSTLLRVVLKIDKNALPGDCDEFPMEPGNRKHVHSLLPEHVKSIGPIVAIETIFDVCVID